MAGRLSILIEDSIKRLVMNEQKKLDEARYFYSQMLAEYENKQKFTYNLSAFLSSARSVLQYGLEEAKAVTGGQQWYDTYVASNSILAFFKSKRDINIHVEPVRPIKHVDIVMIETIGLSDSVHVSRFDASGKELAEPAAEESAHHATERKPVPPPSATVKYRFNDWTGPEDIIELSRMYIDALQSFIDTGIKSSFLTVR
jgi:hypothetical protein